MLSRVRQGLETSSDALVRATFERGLRRRGWLGPGQHVDAWVCLLVSMKVDGVDRIEQESDRKALKRWRRVIGGTQCLVALTEQHLFLKPPSILYAVPGSYVVVARPSDGGFDLAWLVAKSQPDGQQTTQAPADRRAPGGFSVFAAKLKAPDGEDGQRLVVDRIIGVRERCLANTRPSPLRTALEQVFRDLADVPLD